jgi:hypothetical protein
MPRFYQPLLLLLASSTDNAAAGKLRHVQPTGRLSAASQLFELNVREPEDLLACLESSLRERLERAEPKKGRRTPLRNTNDGVPALLAIAHGPIRRTSGSLLDNTMLLHCSSMMAGAKHDNEQLPILVLGGAGVRIKDGPVLDY